MTTMTIDSVKMMRGLRAELSSEMEHMTARERLRYIQDKAVSIPLGRMLAEQGGEAAQQANAADRLPAGH